MYSFQDFARFQFQPCLANRENVEQQPQFSSPELNKNSSQTPNEALFDSFAPGPHKCVHAPHHNNKYKGKESRVHVVRRLNFTSLITSGESNLDKRKYDDEDEEHYLVRIDYGAILGAIVSERQTNQLGVVLGGTPISAPHLSWIAKKCPGAPIKYTSKFRNFDKEICKKLEF